MTEPLLVVGHGTVDEQGVAQFHAFLERLKARMSAAGVDSSGGFIELSAPAVTEAWTELADKGHRRMAAVPLVLVQHDRVTPEIMPVALAAEDPSALLVKQPPFDQLRNRPA